MKIRKLIGEYVVCQPLSLADVDFSSEFCFLSKTDDELSLVCPVAAVPQQCLKREDGWAALKIEGVLDFSLVGILADIAGALAAAGISIFAVSTYNTDYILVKELVVSEAVGVLRQKGYEII